jgi:Flp pilus assembly protein TadG
MTTRHMSDDGGATVELVLLAPLVVLVVGFVLFAGRLGHAAADVRHAAATAARAASLTDTPAAATAIAQQHVNANLADGGPTCAAPAVSVDADVAPGGRVAVTVACPVPLGDLAPIGLPGTKTLTARAVEPVDVYRSTP